MVAQKISELTSLADTAIAGGDFLPIVDVSASQTKKITFADTISAQRFPSRTAMVAQLAVLQTMCPEGAVISDGKLDYVKTTGATAISDFADFLPYGNPSPSHFATNATPGTTNMSAAILAAAVYLTGLGGGVIDGRDEDFGVQTRITFNDTVLGVSIRDCNFYAVSTWAGGTSMFLVTRNGAVERRFISFIDCFFEASNQTNIALVNDAGMVSFIRCRGHGFNEWAIKSTTKATELRIQNCDFKQFYFTDTDFDVEAARTAITLDIDTADYIIIGNVLAYSYEQVNIRTRGPGQLYLNHLYNGGLASATFQTRLGTISGPNCQIMGNYLDNGILRVSAETLDDGPGISIIGNIFHLNADGTNTKQLEIFDGDNSNLAGLILANNLFESASNAVLFTGTFVDDESKLWSVSGNSTKSGAAITGLPVFAARNTMTVSATDGLYFRAPTLRFNPSASETTTEFLFDRSLNIDVDHDDNSSDAESIGTLSVHGVEKFRWSESRLLFSTNLVAINSERLGLGLTPAERLHISGGATDEDSRILMERGYDGTLAPRILQRRSRGSVASPTALLANDRIGVLLFSGHSGSAYGNSAEIRVETLETHASGSTPGEVVISTTPSGSTSLAERVRINEDGLLVTGTIQINDRIIFADQVTIADDAVATITPTFTAGTLDLKCGGGVSTQRLENFSCWISLDIGTTPFAEKSTAFASLGADVNVVTSTVLAGTTGTDGKVTVSAQNNGTFIIENRSGASRTFHLFMT
jgi:hypothetical protein